MKTQSPSGSRGRAGVRISNLPPLVVPSLHGHLHKGGTNHADQRVIHPDRITTANSGSGWPEHVEDGRYGVARIVFGAEPSDEEIQEFVTSKWEKLSFFGGEPAEASKPAKNPKRRAREAAKTLKRPAMSTKAQQALATQRGSDEAGSRLKQEKSASRR